MDCDGKIYIDFPLIGTNMILIFVGVLSRIDRNFVKRALTARVEI